MKCVSDRLQYTPSIHGFQGALFENQIFNGKWFAPEVLTKPLKQNLSLCRIGDFKNSSLQSL